MKKKILFVIDSLRGGGAEKVLTDIVKYMDKDKFDITVLSVFDGGKYVNEVKKYVKYDYIFPEYKSNNQLSKLINALRYKTARFMLRRFNPKYLYTYFVKENYDYEVSFLEGYSAIIVSGSNNRNSTKIAWIHIDLINNPWSKEYFKYQLEKDMYLKFNKIICVSEDVKVAFENKFDIHNNVYVQYNPVAEKIIRDKAKEKLDIKRPNKFLITTIGRLEPQKGYNRLLRVHKRLIDLGYDYELWIIGEGLEREELEKYIIKNNLSKSVKLLGFKKNPYNYLNVSDLFVCSSLTEGFSTVATEATILGVPIVTTDCSGMKELLGDSEYGLITNNSEQDLFIGLKTLLDNSDLYQRYFEKAKERSSEFCLEKRIREVEGLFDTRVEE